MHPRPYLSVVTRIMVARRWVRNRRPVLSTSYACVQTCVFCLIAIQGCEFGCPPVELPETRAYLSGEILLEGEHFVDQDEANHRPTRWARRGEDWVAIADFQSFSEPCLSDRIRCLFMTDCYWPALDTRYVLLAGGMGASASGLLVPVDDWVVREHTVTFVEQGDASIRVEARYDGPKGADDDWYYGRPYSRLVTLEILGPETDDYETLENEAQQLVAEARARNEGQNGG